MEILICNICHVAKSIDEFYKDTSKKRGVRSSCKECHKRTSRDRHNRIIHEIKDVPDNTIQCRGCKLYKTPDMFSKSKVTKNGLRLRCKTCDSKDAKKRRAANPQKYKEFGKTSTAKRRATHAAFLEEIKANKPCADCDKVFPPCCMDFDHIYGEKAFDISARNTASISLLMKEIAKCELVCANCHRIRTKLRLSIKKNNAE